MCDIYPLNTHFHNTLTKMPKSLKCLSFFILGKLLDLPYFLIIPSLVTQKNIFIIEKDKITNKQKFGRNFDIIIFWLYFQLDMNVYSVWRFMLDENEKLGRARLATVQMIQVRKFDNVEYNELLGVDPGRHG